MGDLTNRRHGTTDPAGESEAPGAFERAQETVFEAVGFEPRSRFVDLDSPRVRTHVFEGGPQDGEPTVVFVHGTAEFGAFLTPLMAQFDDARTVAFDRPGYGLSGPFEYTEGTLRGTLVESVAGLVDDLGTDRVDLVGHSMGGLACILYAVTYPDQVRRLSIVGSVPGFPGTRPPYRLRTLSVPLLNRVVRRMQKPGVEGALDMAELFGEREAALENPAFPRAIAAHEADPKSSRTGFSEFTAAFSVLGWRSSVRIGAETLRAIPHPTTVVWGDDDPLGGPDDVRGAVREIPNVRFETISAGHIPFLAHPERCARCIRGEWP